EVNLAEAKLAVADAARQKAEADLAVLVEEVPKRVAIARLKEAIAHEDEKKAADAVPLVRRDVEEGIRAAARGVDAAKASLVLAQEDYTRYSALYRERSVTERKFQEATRSFRTAEAEVQIAEAKRGQAEANRKQIDIAEQQLKSTQHAIAEAAKSVEL